MTDVAPGADGVPRVLDVAVYGIVNTGKSSLINALARRPAAAVGPTGGTTTEVAVQEWREVEAEVGPYAVRLIDTPGIEEIGVAGADRSRLALDAARGADLVLFVLAEDLTATAHAALEALREVGKPLLVAVNKVDLLEPHELDAVLEAIRDRLAPLVPAEDVVPVAAAPLVRERVVDPDGRVRIETSRGAPRIEALEARLVAELAASAGALRALAQAAHQVESHLADRSADRARRRARAEAVADETSVGLALALAVNPLPVLDVLTGSGGIAVLVRRVADVYGARLSPVEVQRLARALLRAGRRVLWGSLAMTGLGGALKFLPGVGHLAGALSQGVAAGTFGHILGRTLVDYFENGHDWGTGGLLAALDRVAEATDRRALTRGLVARLQARLRSPQS